jgi:hypothetical protein
LSVYTNPAKPENPSFRSGMPESSAMDGNLSVVKVFVQTLVCHPWTLDFGIPAKMTGFETLVYNDENRSLGTIKKSSSKKMPCYCFSSFYCF